MKQLISYAQNFEDILLFRAFHHLQKGFYIDVGANDPIEDSVTKLLYDLGWQGINIEPKLDNYKSLVEARPNDINLNCAAGSQKGEIKFYSNNIRGWSTTDAEVGERYVSQNLASIETVEMKTLNDIIEEHFQSEIHFLKVDVEGAEEDVLKGLDLSKYRPWILVIESLDPITNDSVHHSWEPSLINNNYTFMLFDGLNRFYLSNEHLSLSEHFKSPVNVLDKFIPYSLHKLMELNEQHQIRLHALQSLADTEAARANSEAAKVQLLTTKLNDIYSSTSWKVTKPIRFARRISLKATHFFPLVKNSNLINILLKRCLSSVLKRIYDFSLSFPKLRKLVIQYISKKPLLKAWLIKLLRKPVDNNKILSLASIKETRKFDSHQNIETLVPLKKGSRVLYVYVDHTVTCNTKYRRCSEFVTVLLSSKLIFNW